MSDQNPESHVQRMKARVRDVARRSTIGSTIANLGDAVWTSSVATLGERTGTYVRNSWLYTWLTKEPEPEVIVIDLRETWTVGPVIALLDWAIDRTLPYWCGSAIKRGLDRAVALAERAGETRAGQLLIRVLEPPAPPEEQPTQSNRDTEEPRAASSNRDGGETGSINDEP
ncbi:hypothetical protein [Halobaculum gomorrense]|uniref:Uncharacterized protein n=1 Tax=Halobaculum gomorrense TaxID=43928 RepID=A0A1M5UYQ9_9EURY|nr:hypothetical protein [Halobaculum gomorrense]SHH68142.1 hypothetical protein SAMN05443636_3183 [Halobaculum gomorrense]